MKPGERGSSAKRSKRSDRKVDYKLSGRPMDVRLAVEEKVARSKTREWLPLSVSFSELGKKESWHVKNGLLRISVTRPRSQSMGDARHHRCKATLGLFCFLCNAQQFHR